MLEPGRNCWRIERANRAALVVDAANYFRLARQVMLRAKHQLLLIGWDFDTRIRLDPEGEDEGPPTLGEFLSWLPKVHPGLAIHILKWDLGAINLLGRGTTIFRLARWAASNQIFFKLDGAHPPGASHHHKILVADDALAFCGGIDMTASRWDTRCHLDRDERRRRPTTGRRYGPWHDATMAVDGAAARALGELARDRWQRAGGTPIAPPPEGNDPWPQELMPAFSDVDIAIARTRAATGDTRAVREIEAQFVDLINRAERFVYAENQYFASRVVAKAIARRLAEPKGPEFVLVNPTTGDGWLDEGTMSPARATLVAMLRKTRGADRFRIYTPVTEAGEDIYVHSKIMIVDDAVLRVGSANFNNRSMGLDSECDLTIDAQLEADASAAGTIAAIRCDLMAEHLGVTAAEVQQALEKSGSLVGTIEALRGSGRTLMPFVPEEPNELQKAIAETQALDPESAGEAFEPMARPGLVRNLQSLARHGLMGVRRIVPHRAGR